MRLEGKVAIITGGGGGIGRATVHKFVQEGARVLVADLNVEAAQQTVDEVVAAGLKGVAKAHKVNVADLADVEEMVQAAVQEFGHLDIIFNNAGIAGDKALVEQDPDHDYLRVINIDQHSVYYGIVAAGKQFRAQGTGGVIINTSSIYGEQAADLSLSYSAAKAAVISLTRSAAFELAEFGVRAVAITPGRVSTPMINQYGNELGKIFASEQLRDKLTEPEEIANVVAFLASEEANAINGTIVHVDDGYSVFKNRLPV